MTAMGWGGTGLGPFKQLCNRQSVEEIFTQRRRFGWERKSVFTEVRYAFLAELLCH